MSSFNQSVLPLTGSGSGVKRNKVLPHWCCGFAVQSICHTNQTLSLRELLGRPVILAFYPADWSPVCGDQMALYNEILPEFAKYQAALVGISVDSVWCHAAFAAARNLHFPLASDFEPKGLVARLYRAYREPDGTSERALFVIDRTGTIAWSYLSPVALNPGAAGILEALDKLTRKTLV